MADRSEETNVPEQPELAEFRDVSDALKAELAVELSRFTSAAGREQIGRFLVLAHRNAKLRTALHYLREAVDGPWKNMNTNERANLSNTMAAAENPTIINHLYEQTGIRMAA